MGDYDSDDERRRYEDELYNDDPDDTDAGDLASQDSGDEEAALSHVNYTHSFHLEHEDDPADVDNKTTNGNILPDDLTTLAVVHEVISDDEVEEENVEDMEISDGETPQIKPPPPPKTLEVKVLKMRSADDLAAQKEAVAIDDVFLDVGGRRKENRYFEENTGPFCRMCRKNGHIMRECPEKERACYLCREDHDPARCPMNNLCFKCMHRGHINSDCPNGRDYSICEYCDSDKHHPYQCPWQWRHYVFAPYKGDQVPKELAVYCYNCGQEGHFGDDCRQRLITGNKGISAFALAALVQAFPQHRKGSKYCPPRRQSPETGRIDHDRRRSPPHHRQPVHKRFADSPISDSRSRSRSRSRSPRGSRRRSYSRSRSRSRSRDRYNNNKRHALPPRPRGRYPSRSPSPPPLRARRKSRSPPVAHRYDRGFRPYSPPPLPTYRSSRDERERGERERGGRRREDYRRESPPPQVRESKRNGYRNAPPPSPPPPPARRVNLKYQPSYKGGY